MYLAANYSINNLYIIKKFEYLIDNTFLTIKLIRIILSFVFLNYII